MTAPVRTLLPAEPVPTPPEPAAAEARAVLDEMFGYYVHEPAPAPSAEDELADYAATA